MNKEITELPSATPVEELSYEQALSEMESIVSELETADQALESSIALYERGQALAQYCTELLDKAELRVKKLSGEEITDY